jgi:hypothetical protein
MADPSTVYESSGFFALSKADQIHYRQWLWDRISESPEEIPVPDEHLAVAEERLSRYRANPDAARPANEVIDRLTAGLGASSRCRGFRRSTPWALS